MAHACDTDDNMRSWDRASKHHSSVQEKSNILLFDRMAEPSSGYIKDRNAPEMACDTVQMTGRLSKPAEKCTATDSSDGMMKEAGTMGIENAAWRYRTPPLLITATAHNSGHRPEGDPQGAHRPCLRLLEEDQEGQAFLHNLAGFRMFHEWDMKGTYADAHSPSSEKRSCPRCPSAKDSRCSEKHDPLHVWVM